MAATDGLNSQRFYHGTKADLKPGNLIEPGYSSNYGKRKKAAYVYLTATLNAATFSPLEFFSQHSPRNWRSQLFHIER